MRKFAFLLFGVTAYLAFFAVVLYMIGFVGGFIVPKTIDSGPTIPALAAFTSNILLIALFGLQHTVMARPGFKAWLTRHVPHAIERSVYVLLSSVLLAAMFALWQPVPDVVWAAEGGAAMALTGLYFAGWALVFASTFIIDHFDLFGLKQVYMHALDRVPVPARFKVTFLYRIVRHPLMLGWIVVFWATPVMTMGHLLFAAGMTAYILAALPYEERDLVAAFGEDYRNYQRRVPSLIPFAGAFARLLGRAERRQAV